MYDKHTMLQLFSALPEDQQQQALGSVGIDTQSYGGHSFSLGLDEDDELKTWDSTDISVPDSMREQPYTDGIHIKQHAAQARMPRGYLPDGHDDISELSMYQPEAFGMEYGTP